MNFRQNNFDLLRLLAALQVVFIHAYTHLDIVSLTFVKDAIDLFPGVPIFFVISGFLISSSLESVSSLKEYLVNRFLRIYPGLWVCFIISVISFIFIYDFEYRVDDVSYWVISQISIFQFYNPEFMRGYGVGVLNGSLWTIPVEIQFYILLPVLYKLFFKSHSNRLAVVLIIMLSAATSVFLNFYPQETRGIPIKLLSVSLLPYLYMFLFGVLLFRNIDFVERYLKGNFLIFLMIYFFFKLVLLYFNIEYSGNHIDPISAFLLSLATISFAYSYTNKLGNLIKGYDISYGIYIYHMIIINMIIHIGIFQEYTALFIIFPLTVLVAFFSWTFVERPVLKLKRSSIKK